MPYNPDAHFIQRLIADYEMDLLDREIIFEFSNGEIIVLDVKPESIPHLLGVKKLGLRQTAGKSALEIYDLLKRGVIQQRHYIHHGEEYRKLVNFNSLTSILYCGDAVKVVKRIGHQTSGYFLYLDHRNSKKPEIIHLGIRQSAKTGRWFPDALIVQQHRNVDKYIKGQEAVEIIKSEIHNIREA